MILKCSEFNVQSVRNPHDSQYSDIQYLEFKDSKCLEFTRFKNQRNLKFNIQKFNVKYSYGLANPMGGFDVLL